MKNTSCVFVRWTYHGCPVQEVCRTAEDLSWTVEKHPGCELFYFDHEADESLPYNPETVEFVDDPEYV